MFKKGILIDIIIFAVVALFLFAVIPVISSVLRQLVILQIIITIAGALVLRYIVQKIRRKAKG